MTTLGVSSFMLQCVFEGSLSMKDTEIERRPYHKNCNCALHKSKGGACSNSGSHQRSVSFPMKKSWTDSSLCKAKTSTSSKHSIPSNTSTFTNGNRESVDAVHY